MKSLSSAHFLLLQPVSPPFLIEIAKNWLPNLCRNLGNITPSPSSHTHTHTNTHTHTHTQTRKTHIKGDQIIFIHFRLVGHCLVSLYSFWTIFKHRILIKILDDTLSRKCILNKWLKKIKSRITSVTSAKKTENKLAINQYFQFASSSLK